MARITRIEIKGYGGVRDLSIAVPPAGAIVKGRNGAGKSTVLKAIAAALAAQGIGPDNIRVGEDGAEILVDIDAVRVRRAITKKGTSLTVTNADGDEWRKPQTRLTDLLGTSPLDPLGFFLAKADERRRMVLEAMPVTVTAEDVERWTGSPQASVPLEGHGLEVVRRIREIVYNRRTDANRQAKAMDDDRRRAEAAAQVDPDLDADLLRAPSVEDALAAAAAVKLKAGDIGARQTAAAQAREKTEKTRTRIHELRGRAEALANVGARMPTDAAIADAKLLASAAARTVARLRAELADAEIEQRLSDGHVETLQEQVKAAESAATEAAGYEQQANELEESIASLTALAPTEAEIAAVKTEAGVAQQQLERANQAADLRERAAFAKEARLKAEAAAVEADRLDGIVKTLTDIAPVELAQRSDMLPGLTLDGDGIYLDGVSIDSLSSAEQMRFAVELCRRLNAKAKILVVDGLERLDPDSLDAFVGMATDGGYQLIGTRVDRGELVVEAIAPDAKAAA